MRAKKGHISSHLAFSFGNFIRASKRNRVYGDVIGKIYRVALFVINYHFVADQHGCIEIKWKQSEKSNDQEQGNDIGCKLKLDIFCG